MAPTPKSYDVRCEELAKLFLDDHAPYSAADLATLAQDIQTTIEDFLAAKEAQR